MMERKTGWYKIEMYPDSFQQLAMYDSNSNSWDVVYSDCMNHGLSDDDIYKIDPQMVMTPDGELVYHNAQHDPLYNTAQEQ